VVVHFVDIDRVVDQSPKESLNSDDQQLYQYQQSEQPPVT
jgi:hypothetical protein